MNSPTHRRWIRARIHSRALLSSLRHARAPGEGLRGGRRGGARTAGAGRADDRPRSEPSMSDSSTRRPLALTATIATSVAAAAGMIAPAAHATTASPNGTANLTLSGGYGVTTPSSGTANVN